MISDLPPVNIEDGNLGALTPRDSKLTKRVSILSSGSSADSRIEMQLSPGRSRGKSLISAHSRNASSLTARQIREALSDMEDQKGRVTLSRAESNALARNLYKKEAKIERLWKEVVLCFFGIIGLVVLCVVTNIVANNYMHISKGTNVNEGSNQLTSFNGDGGVIETSRVSSYVPLSDLSRASLNFLEQMDMITVASGTTVHSFRISGFSLYDKDALDLRTDTETMLQIRCGNARIKWSDGKLEDVEEISDDGKRARRALSGAGTIQDFQRLYNDHVDAEEHHRRMLKYENPLFSLYAFFGGMVRSSSDSTLYGELAPDEGGCKPPVKLITISRPTIPEHSKWTVNVKKGDRPDQQRPDVWFMSWDQSNSMPMLRFESPDEECRKHVTISTMEKTYSFHQIDFSLCGFTGNASAKEAIPCPSSDMGINMTCAEYREQQISSQADVLMLMDGSKESCLVEGGIEAQNNLQVKLSDAKVDGSSVWEIGFFEMKVNPSGTPVAIRPLNRDGEEDAEYFDVLKIEPFDPDGDESMWQGCQPDAENDGDKRRLAHSRRLDSFLVWLQRIASITWWCGAGTNLKSTPCPGTGVMSQVPGYDLKADRACRRHDQMGKWKMIGPFPKTGCNIDHAIVKAGGHNGALNAVFGSWGLAGAFGCFDMGAYNCWRWRRKWWGGYWWYGKYCTGEHTHYGPWRYNSYKRKYGYAKKEKVCSDDIW